MDERATRIAHAPTAHHQVVRRDRPGATDRTHLVKVVGASDLLVVRGTRDQKIATIAGAQRGRVARRQLLAAGITPSMIRTMLRQSWLHPLHLGVYAVGHLAPIDLGRETAALLACPDGVLSFRTATTLWKLRPGRPNDPVDVTLTGGQARRAGIRVHRTHRLDPQDICIHEDLPVTTPARTLLDIAETLTVRELERALDEALVSRIVRASHLADVLSRNPKRAGAPRLRAVLERRVGPSITRSQAEERFLAMVRAAQLPEPEINVRIEGYEVDFLWRKQHVVVEVDGYMYHSSRRAFVHDRRKDAKLKAAGWDPNRVTWDQMDDEPFAVIARVAQRLAEARAA